MAGQWWFPSHHLKYICFILAACVDSSLHLSISAETIHTASHFKLLSKYKTWITAPLLHLTMGQDANQDRCSSLWPLCFVLSQPMYPTCSFLSKKNIGEKRVIASLIVYLVNVSNPLPWWACCCLPRGWRCWGWRAGGTGTGDRRPQPARQAAGCPVPGTTNRLIS
jgi:hypothetical protein